MIDDSFGVSENGVHATQLNAFVNIKTAEKKLQFGHDKCNTLTIAHKNVRYVRTDLTIVWLQQTVRSSCWSSHRMGISLQPTHKQFISAYLKNEFVICRKFLSDTLRLYTTFSY